MLCVESDSFLNINRKTLSKNMGDVRRKTFTGHISSAYYKRLIQGIDLDSANENRHFAKSQLCKKHSEKWFSFTSSHPTLLSR